MSDFPFGLDVRRLASAPAILVRSSCPALSRSSRARRTSSSTSSAPTKSVRPLRSAASSGSSASMLMSHAPSVVIAIGAALRPAAAASLLSRERLRLRPDVGACAAPRSFVSLLISSPLLSSSALRADASLAREPSQPARSSFFVGVRALREAPQLKETLAARRQPRLLPRSSPRWRCRPGLPRPVCLPSHLFCLAFQVDCP